MQLGNGEALTGAALYTAARSGLRTTPKSQRKRAHGEVDDLHSGKQLQARQLHGEVAHLGEVRPRSQPRSQEPSGKAQAATTLWL